MKIRIKGNSLRYRLTKSDIHNFTENGYIEEHTNFGERTLIYALQKADNGQLSAKFENNGIVLYMPEELANEWALTDRVGFDGEYKGLSLLIEKDFKCLDNVAEDQSDNYPNPLALRF